MSDQVGREPQYDTIAEEFLRHARDGFFNAYYDRPACLSLLGDVAGRRVLDAACGPGLYAEELIRRGADVVGFDQSPRMVEIARERAGQGDFRVHDLADPIVWLPDSSVDLVLFALAIEYVDDRVAALRELRRVLRPGGALVFSRQHPTGDWLRHGGSYFDVRVIHETWSTGWQVQYWLAPLQTTCEEIFRAGFLIERLLEPRPVPEAAACASVTTGSATGCPRPSCTPDGGSTWTGPIRAGRAGGRLSRASAASSMTCRSAWDGQRVVVIGHVATRWGLDHFIRGASLEDLMDEDFAWQEGWEYRLG